MAESVKGYLVGREIIAYVGGTEKWLGDGVTAMWTVKEVKVKGEGSVTECGRAELASTGRTDLFALCCAFYLVNNVEFAHAMDERKGIVDMQHDDAFFIRRNVIV